jgi:hypothetical protein
MSRGGMKTLAAALTPILLTSCGGVAQPTEKSSNCKPVTLVLVNVHDQSATLSVDGHQATDLLIRPNEGHGMPSGSIERRICGRAVLRFRSGSIDNSQIVDASGPLRVVYVDPTAKPIIRPTNHASPLLD